MALEVEVVGRVDESLWLDKSWKRRSVKAWIRGGNEEKGATDPNDVVTGGARGIGWVGGEGNDRG